MRQRTFSFSIVWKSLYKIDTICYLNISQDPSVKLCGLSFFFFKLINYLFIFGCVGSSLLRMGFLQLWRAGAILCCGAAGFSLRWLLLLQSTGSRRTRFSSCVLRALERRLSSCGPRVQLLRSMWDLPGPGLEPVSPALAGGYLTTVPPGKSRLSIFCMKILDHRFNFCNGYRIIQVIYS